MTREDFLKKCALMGMGITVLPSLLTSCETEELNINFSGRVLVIGAGSAGMMAGYMLKKHNIDFQIIEASSRFGGRVRKADHFADFPIDLGAEWVHDQPSIFSRMLDDSNMEGQIDLVPYNPETVYIWQNQKLHKVNFGSNLYGEYKFSRTTWYDFFDQFILPSIEDEIIYDSPVTEIDYSGDTIQVSNATGATFEADKVIVTVPISILKSQEINFVPSFPSEKVEALGQTTFPDGIKVFMEFEERFYPDILLMSDDETESIDEKIYYNAAFKKDSDKNILALFNVGPSASFLTNLSSEGEIIQKVLGELDEMFDGKASQHYKKHIVQNWSAEPYIQGSYTFYNANEYQTMETLSKPLENKVYFAGEALSTYASATVQGAGLSAIEVVKGILTAA